jgi:hypothetical protein
VKLFGRRPHVPAEVGDGFVAGEAVALQTSFTAALDARERAAGDPVNAELVVEPGRGELVVLVWRNVVVGFVPPAHRDTLREQLAVAGNARLVTSGQVFRRDDTWHVWVGPPRAAFPETEPGTDRLAAPPCTIFGIALPTPPPD